MAALKLSLALPVLVALLLAAASLAAAQGPPKAEVVAELQGLKRALRFRPKYSLIRRVASILLSRQDDFPEDFDFSDVVNKTLLLPTNAAIIGAGVRKIPTNEAEGEQYEALGLMNVLDGYLTMEDIKAPGATFTTVHDGTALTVKETRSGGVVALGQDGQKRGKWSVVVDPTLFKGKFVVVHGVNRMQLP
ncbi:hypothetical protein CLOM_g8326 [Closterium sp. NIES-68]|nr:hypothetical protein CLOM_g8326 [Closterium sp. NIES-68]